MEQKRIENEISLQTYLRSLIQSDKERRMQLLIEKESTQSSTNSLTILKHYLSKISNHQNTTTNLASVVAPVSPKITATYNTEINIVIDQHYLTVPLV